MRLTLIVLATFSLGAILGAADFTGTWKLNMEKSKLQTNNNIASETMTISQTGPNTNTTIDTVTKSGEKLRQDFSRIYDGKEHPASGGGTAQRLTEICEQIGTTERKITGKLDGKILGTISSTVSPDGKAMTNTSSANGEVLVYDRQ